MSYPHISTLFSRCSILLLVSIQGCGPLPPGGDGEAEQEPEMFSTPPDPASLREITTTCDFDDGTQGPCTWNIPVNQLVVMMEEDASFETALASLQDLLADLGDAGIEAELAGQIPSLLLFQIQIVNDEPDAALAYETLRAAEEIVQAGQHVVNIAYNFLIEPRAYTPMEPDDDNTRHIRSSYRSGLAAIDYYQAIPLFDEILDGHRSALTPVTVGIVDTGLATNTQQFDDVVLRIITDDFSDTRGHGTGITALIAADNGDALVNGIASRVINGARPTSPSRLSIVFAKGDFVSLSAHFGTLLQAERVVQEGVDIVNLSLGYGHHYRRAQSMTIQGFRHAREHWLRFFRGERATSRDAADVLFVVAAPNEDIRLTDRNDFPSGISLNNVITVGGIDTDSLYARAPLTASGSLINISAPSTNVPFLRPREGRPVGSVDVTQGTSVSTAMITAMAAIMYAVNPSATPSQVKNFFRSDDNTWPADRSAGGRRAALIRTVGRYMLQHGRLSGAEAVLDTLDGANGTPDPSAYCMNQSISDEATIVDISGPDGASTRTVYGSDFVRASGKFNNSGGILTGGDSTFSVQVDSFSLGAGQLGTFELNRPYPMDGEAFATLAIIQPGAVEAEYSGAAVAGGTLVYTACEITTRSLPLNLDTLAEGLVAGHHTFIFVQVEGAFDALIEGADLTSDPPDFPVYYNLDAEFTTIFMLLNIDEATRNYLEENCVGGYQYGYDP